MSMFPTLALHVNCLIYYSNPVSKENMAYIVKFQSSYYFYTGSDAELKLKLVSNTGMGTVAPHVTFHVAAPPTTAAIMSRTSGPRDQTITFSPDNKTITWTISQFPGGSYAQAFIRVSNNPGCTYLFSPFLSFIPLPMYIFLCLILF